MARIQLARGPVVAALQRHDAGLRVRWSHEKRKWAVDAPFLRVDEQYCPPPVRWRQIGTTDMWIQEQMPEYSERHIQYHDRRYVICYVKRITRALIAAIIGADTARHRQGAVGLFDDAVVAQDAARRRAADYRRGERVYAGFDRLKFHLRKNPYDEAIGVSIKGVATS